MNRKKLLKICTLLLEFSVQNGLHSHIVAFILTNRNKTSEKIRNVCFIDNYYWVGERSVKLKIEIVVESSKLILKIFRLEIKSVLFGFEMN